MYCGHGDMIEGHVCWMRPFSLSDCGYEELEVCGE